MVDGFDAKALVKLIDDCLLYTQAKEIDDDAQPPNTFEYDNWIDWNQ